MSLNQLKAHVAVTGMNATDNPAPGVGIVRALRAEPTFCGNLIGLGYDPLDPGFYAAGLLNGAALMPYPSSGRDALLAQLMRVRSSHGIDVLMPSLDSELRAISALRGHLHTAGIHTFVPDLDAIERSSKPRLPELDGVSGIRVPESATVTSAEELATKSEELGFPLVVKGPFYGAEIVRSLGDALAAFYRFASTWGTPIVLQRFIAGEEYNVAALGDGQGGTVGAVAMRKMALTDKGKGWSGVTISNRDLLSQGEAVIRALRWRGPLEVEILRERRSGDLYIIEINPRFPAWIFLSAAAGQNLPYYAVRLALGLDVPSPAPPYRVGTMFVRISLDQVSDLSTYEQLTSNGVLPLQEVQS